MLARGVQQMIFFFKINRWRRCKAIASLEHQTVVKSRRVVKNFVKNLKLIYKSDQSAHPIYTLNTLKALIKWGAGAAVTLHV